MVKEKGQSKAAGNDKSIHPKLIGVCLPHPTQPGARQVDFGGRERGEEGSLRHRSLVSTIQSEKYPQPSQPTQPGDIMDVRVGLLCLLLLGGVWACAARQIATSEISTFTTTISDESAVDKDQKNEVAKNSQLCTLCEEFSAQALDYLAANKTQTEIIEMLHLSCSKLHSFKEQCITLVDYYAPLFFLEISSIQPEAFCQKVNLCEEVAIISTELKKDSCGLCHRIISEVLVKLKDPDTQLEILEVLLKACNSMENYKAQCKKLVFEYGPVILVNAEQFLETTDVCTMLHACDSPTASSIQEVSTGGRADS